MKGVIYAEVFKKKGVKTNTIYPRSYIKSGGVYSCPN